MAADGFTTVHYASGDAEAEMLAGALREEAIDARVVAVNAPLMGAGSQIFPVRIEVPVELAARARELLEELGHPGTLEDASMPPEAGEPGAATPQRSPRRTGIGLLVPGGGHFYARLPWTALGIEVGLLACVVTLALEHETPFTSYLLYTALFALPVCDVAGAYHFVRAFNRGAAIPGRLRQLARAVALVGVAAALGAAVASVGAIPSWIRGARFGKLTLRCSDREITVENHTEHKHLIFINDVRVSSAELPDDGLYIADWAEPAQLRLAPGQQAGLPFRAPAAMRRLCEGEDGRRTGDCAVEFRAAVQDLEATDAPPFEAKGHCVPPWKGGAFAPATMRLLPTY